MARIERVVGQEILDSRGNPAISAYVSLNDGAFGRAAVPSGASTGTREAVELRDGDAGRFGGKGVLFALANVEGVLAGAVVGREAGDQRGLDQAMRDADGTPNKSRLGANAILGVSLATARAQAQSRRLPLYRYLAELAGRTPEVLPVPALNVLNGGRHAANSTDIQEYMIVPQGAPTFAESLRWAAEVYHTLGSLIHDRGLATTVGDEGGYAPSLPANRAAIELIIEAIKRAGYQPGTQVALALDPAASEFYQDDAYHLRRDGLVLTSAETIAFYADWLEQFPIVSLEDGLAEQDWDGWKALCARLGRRLQLVGDDIFATNPGIIQQGTEQHVANAVLIKLNQIGTLTETIEAVALARGAGWKAMVSHRSGETSDSFIADLVVGLGLDQIKAGAPARGERVAKYNRLMEIEAELGALGRFAGPAAFALGAE